MVAPNIDATDRQLISELVHDGRATYAQLAPRVGLSQAATRSRVQRLLDERIITVTGRVDPSTFGLGVFAFVFLEVAGELDKTGARIAEVDEAVFVVAGTGRFDLLVELRCRDDEHLLQALDRIRVLDDVRRMQTVTVLHYEKQDWTNIGEHDVARPPERPALSPEPIDEIDRALVLALLADGRATYAALAPLVGLSQAAVRDRVLDLIDSRVVSIQAHPSPDAFGLGGFAGLAVKTSGPVTPIADLLAARAETTVVARTLGRFEIVSEVWFHDQDHLALVLDELRSVDGIGSIDTIPYLRLVKENFGAGIRSS